MVVDGKVVLVSDLKLFRLLVWVGKGEEMEAIATLKFAHLTRKDLVAFGEPHSRFCADPVGAFLSPQQGQL